MALIAVQNYDAYEKNQEKAAYVRRPDWELKNVIKALNHLPGLNTGTENARLAACEEIVKERRKERRLAKKKK